MIVWSPRYSLFTISLSLNLNKPFPLQGQKQVSLSQWLSLSPPTDHNWEQKYNTTASCMSWEQKKSSLIADTQTKRRYFLLIYHGMDGTTLASDGYPVKSLVGVVVCEAQERRWKEGKISQRKLRLAFPRRNPRFHCFRLRFPTSRLHGKAKVSVSHFSISAFFFYFLGFSYIICFWWIIFSTKLRQEGVELAFTSLMHATHFSPTHHLSVVNS